MSPPVRRPVFVTGGTERIGYYLASRFAAEGTPVAVFSRNADKAERSALTLSDKFGVDCRGFAADCLHAAQLRDAYLLAAARLGAPCTVIHCAAYFAKDDALAFDPDIFDRSMRVNCAAGLQLASLTASLPDARGASVIFFGDYVTAKTPETFLSYTASKAALEYAMRAAALQLAPSGVRVNMIAPAAVLRTPGQRQEHFNELCRRMPLGGPVQEEELYRCVQFLTSAPSLTGQTLYADGGARLAHEPYA